MCLAYSLPDGTNTPRQLTDAQGEVTLAVRYTPWGDTLETYGDGGFAFGYFGGLMDAATGLLYIGNGQYYDPVTGRFLTRDAKPGSPNPYVPWSLSSFAPNVTTCFHPNVTIPLRPKFTTQNG